MSAGLNASEIVDDSSGESNSQAIQYKVGSEVTKSLAYKIIIVSVSLLAMVYILLILFKKYFPMQTLGVVQGKRIVICETRYLTRNTQVALISVDKKEYILAMHGNTVSVVEHDSIS